MAAPQITYQTPEAIAMAELALCRRTHKFNIKAMLTKHFVDNGLPAPSGNSIERILSRAREALATRINKSRADHRGEAYALYDSILNDPHASIKDKLYAQERIDKLLGLEVKVADSPAVDSSDAASKIMGILGINIRPPEPTKVEEVKEEVNPDEPWPE